MPRCRADGVSWAIRPTGGRAIFHAEEWTYSLAARLDDPNGAARRGETYARVSELLRDSLAVLGVPADWRSVRRGEPRRAARAAPRLRASPPPTRHELVLGGRKLAGSAQRRGARALLQQGSVLLSDRHLRLADYLRLPEAERGAARRALAAASAHAGDRIPPGTPLTSWAAAIEAVVPGGMRRQDAAPAMPLTR